MKKFIKSLLFVFLLQFSIIANALIVTTDKISDITKYVDRFTLIVFDLDNTIIKPNQTLASDQWFEAKLKQLEGSDAEKAEQIEQILNIYRKAQQINKVTLVEADAANVIAELQKKYKRIIALTSRGSEIQNETINQLESVGVSFNHGIGKHKEFNFIENSKAKFYRGILFASGQHKGNCLKEFLEKDYNRINKIVFIDDSIVNVKRVDDFAKSKGIDCVAIRYNRLEDEINNVNLDVAKIQTEYLNNIISDEEAKVILEHRKNKLAINFN